MTKRFAAHQVVTSVNDRFKQYVVEVEGDAVSRMFPLTEEIAFTEWLGGMIILSSSQDAISRIAFPVQIEVLIAFLTENSEPRRSHAWHISPEDVSNGLVRTVRLLSGDETHAKDPTCDGIPHKR